MLLRFRAAPDGKLPLLATCPIARHVSTLQILITVERVAGIEPASQAWKASALPLSYTRPSGECALPVL